MKTSIVVGLGFGDEGKGFMVAQLSRQSSKALVVRFSGGHQCGHTVVKDDGTRHVFAQFGSGALSGADTFYSKNCTVDPAGLVKEYEALKELGVEPKIYIDPLAPVATYFDRLYNRFQEGYNKHGSCGVGFGTTIQRHESGVKLFAKDLKYPEILDMKLQAIEQYYAKLPSKFIKKANLDEIKWMCAKFKKSAALMPLFADIINESTVLDPYETSKYDHIIFEGNQGILLDAEHGFFPNVTRSSTTTKLALEIINRNAVSNPRPLPAPRIYYMHRAYLTRHGNGWLPGEDIDIDINPNPKETNVFNDWQKEFRKAPLNSELFNYALDTDDIYSGDLVMSKCKKNIVFTCVNQLKSTDSFFKFVDNLKDKYLNKYRYFLSCSDSSDKNLTEYKGKHHEEKNTRQEVSGESL